MPKHATILIPDISGYTEFMARTDLEFSTLVLCELLNELMNIASNEFRVAEIEGDAILFYCKDQKLQADELVDYCLRAYTHFHGYLQHICRRVNDPEARKAAEKLTLKFIAHWGPIAEISIANFYKPVGVSLIKVHKLLKNGICSRAYILFTEEFAEAQVLPTHNLHWPQALEWRQGEEEYPVLGPIKFRYVLLEPEEVIEQEDRTT